MIWIWLTFMEIVLHFLSNNKTRVGKCGKCEYLTRNPNKCRIDLLLPCFDKSIKMGFHYFGLFFLLQCYFYRMWRFNRFNSQTLKLHQFKAKVTIFIKARTQFKEVSISLQMRIKTMKCLTIKRQSCCTKINAINETRSY